MKKPKTIRNDAAEFPVSLVFTQKLNINGLHNPLYQGEQRVACYTSFGSRLVWRQNKKHVIISFSNSCCCRPGLHFPPVADLRDSNKFSFFCPNCTSSLRILYNLESSAAPGELFSPVHVWKRVPTTLFVFSQQSVFCTRAHATCEPLFSPYSSYTVGATARLCVSFHVFCALVDVAVEG